MTGDDAIVVIDRLVRVLSAAAAAAALVAPAAGAQRTSPLPYEHTGTISLGTDGITGLTVDPESHRLYMGHRRGALYVDLAESPRVKGPLTKIRITGDVEFAPGLGKLFFAVQDAIGYTDVRRDLEPIPMGVVDRATNLVYEPTRRELYVFSSAPRVTIFDARSGEQGPTIELPGWFGHNAVVAGGRVFFNLGGHQGIYTIDIDTRRVAAFPVTGRLVSPFRMEADPEGRFLFVAPFREIVAIDIAKAAIVGRIPLPSTPGLAYDAKSGLLVASWAGPVLPLHLAAYRPDERGLTEVASVRAPAGARTGLEPTHGGFVQLGRNMLGAPTLLVWTARAR